MASFRAIAAVSLAVLGLLEEGCPRSEFPSAQFELLQPSELPSRSLDEGVSLCLYRVEISSARRHLPPRVRPDGIRYRAPLPVDLHYLLTAWGRSADKQQLLLAWCMRMLEDTPALPSGVLNHAVADPQTFGAPEAAEILYEPLSLQDLANVWEGGKKHLSVGYVVRMVLLESDVPLIEAQPVQTRDFVVGTRAEE